MNSKDIEQVQLELLNCAKATSIQTRERMLMKWWDKNISVVSHQHMISENTPERFQTEDYLKYRRRNVGYEMGESLLTKGFISEENVTDDLDRKTGIIKRDNYAIHCVVLDWESKK